MTEQINVGFVGLGVISKTHFEVLASMPEVRLQFTVDPLVDSPPEFRGSRPLHFDELGGALKKHEPDVLVLATPTETHAELVTQALTTSPVPKILVEKPVVHSLAALDALRGLDSDLQARVFTAHHAAFSPEVDWAARCLADHPDWGPVTAFTSAFYDPYVLLGRRAVDSYVSSWMDSGVNQLSILSRLVELRQLTYQHDVEGASGSWASVSYMSHGQPGVARLRSGWLTGASSKESVVLLGESGVEVWIDHTAMTAFAFRGDELLEVFTNDGSVPRKIAHYRPLYRSLLSAHPDPVLTFDTAELITRIHLVDDGPHGGSHVEG